MTRQIEKVDKKARRQNSVPLTRVTREETLNIELTVDLPILMIKRCELPTNLVIREVEVPK